MEITSAVFKGSFVSNEKCPALKIPEFAFIGRSNVGKSSLINMLCRKKDLVKISGSPGKTRTMNFFLINDQFHFVDLPGYGYAKRSIKERKQWEAMIKEYLAERRELKYLFVLIDSRIPPQKIDLDFLNQLGEIQLPFVLTFTKTDKQSNNQIQQKVNAFHKEMSASWENMPITIVTSAISKKGREEILKFINQSL